MTGVRTTTFARNAVAGFPIGLVTPTVGHRESGTIENRNATAIVANQSAVLPRSGGFGDANLVHARYQRKECMWSNRSRWPSDRESRVTR